MDISRVDYDRPKGVLYSGESMKEIDALIFSPLFLDRMPKNVKGRRNRMVLWAIKELEKVLSNGIKEQQLYFNFK